MSDRRKRLQTNNKLAAYIAAGLVHALIIAALVFNFTSTPDSIEANSAEKIDVVNATTIEESEILKQQDELKQKERDKRLAEENERKRLQELKEQKAQEEQRIEDLKEKQKEEADKAAELEKQRKEIALKRKQEEEKQKAEEEQRKKEEAERKRREALAAQKREEERKRQEELDRIRREEQELQMQREMNERIQQEEAALARQRAEQRAATLSSRYAALIKQRVQPKITISPDFAPTLSTRMNVKLSSSGDVQRVSIIKSSGNSAYDRAVETAIYASSPLPIPSRDEDPEVNKMFQDLTLNFSIDGR